MILPHKLHQAKGYTVVELVIALSVVGLVVLMVTNFAVSNLVQYTITNSRANLLGQAQLALDVINDDIRLSAGVEQVNRWEDEFGPAGETDIFSWESNDQTLILATAAENDAGEILFADASQYIPQKNNVIYYLDDGVLYKRVLAAPVEGNTTISTCPSFAVTESCPADRLLMDKVTGFSLTYSNSQGEVVDPADARSVEVAIELSERKFGEDVTVDYVTRMVFRND